MKKVTINEVPVLEWVRITNHIMGTIIAKITKIKEYPNSYEYRMKGFWETEDDGWYVVTDEEFEVFENGDKTVLYNKDGEPLLVEYWDGYFFTIGKHLKPAEDE